ncbi:MAG: AlkA N-terminal domain-containing protein [Pseudomonadota bacterium]
MDPATCREAHIARDARFDGVFYLAVKTTGIYCRPVCPARIPSEHNVRYYSNTAQAARDGYRPCLRCRPESAPGSPAWLGTQTTLNRALSLIQSGALNRESLPQLAERLGVGDRYLRKLFQQSLGVSPSAVALNQRLLFAKKLLAETCMPMSEVAFAAGFGSVRRFNSAVKSQFNLAPTALRRQSAIGTVSELRLTLHYRPPYDWEGVLNYFSRHAIAGVESISDTGYRRTLSLGPDHEYLEVRPISDQHALQLSIQSSRPEWLMPIVANVRRMFDLDANPAVIARFFNQDPDMARLLARCPGIRSPGTWSLFESAFRTIVGQQVSTQAARTLLGSIIDAAGRSGEFGGFASPAKLASLPDGCYRMPQRRRECLRALCRLASERGDLLCVEEISALPGVGPWSRAMIAMRGAGRPDVFPCTDLGLLNAWQRLQCDGLLAKRSVRWRPWGAYAANLLWRSLET